MKGNKLASIFKEQDENSNYWTDGKTVYFRHYKISGADIESFEQFPGCWAKDKKNCYLTNTKLKNADPLTFEVLNYTYAKDKNNAWTMGSRIEGADCETFVVCDNGKNSLGVNFKKGLDGKIEQYELFAPYGYAKDKNNVYYYDYQGKTKLVKKAIASSFISLQDGYFGRDEKSVFCGASIIPKANPLTWTKLLNGYFYSKDGNKVYYFNRLIDEADAKTFEIVIVPSIFERDAQYAKDKNNCYMNDTISPIEEFNKLISRDTEHNVKMKEKWGV